ncbi:MAG: glycosyltransferase [Arachnia sp.]
MTSKPRVVLFRHAPVDFDSRIKRIATTLHRGGFEPIVISVEPKDGESGEFLLGGHTRVIRVPLQQWPSASTEVPAPSRNDARAGRLQRQRGAYGQRITGANVASVKALIKWLMTTAKLALVHGMQLKETAVTAGKAARIRIKGSDDPFEALDLPRNLPVAHNVVYTLHDLLVELDPDVLHVHNPLALPAAWAAARSLRLQGKDVKLSYDVREDFAGLPDKEIGSRSAHEALLGTERAFMPKADYVMTVTASHATMLQERYKLPVLPDTIVNLSVFQPMVGDVTVREAAGVAEGTPLLVYAGIMSWARGIETLIQAMAHVADDVHLAIVTMPLPHPMMTKLQPLIDELGVNERIHFIGPVSQANLSYYLHGADVAVHPLPGGSDNHDRTLPNKLFEYLHAELPMVSSDAKTMAEFVLTNKMGNVFKTGDPVDLAAKMMEMLRDPIPQERLHTLAQEFSWQSNEPRLLEQFGKLAHFQPHLEDGPFGSTEVTPA